MPWTSGDTEDDRSLFDALPEKHLIFWNVIYRSLKTLFDSTFSKYSCTMGMFLSFMGKRLVHFLFHFTFLHSYHS